MPSLPLRRPPTLAVAALAAALAPPVGANAPDIDGVAGLAGPEASPAGALRLDWASTGHGKLGLPAATSANAFSDGATRDALARPAIVTGASGAFCFGLVEPLEERKARDGVSGAGFVPESLTGCADRASAGLRSADP